MYKQTVSIEKQLQKISNENSGYGELWATWNLNKKTLEPILNAIIKDYPHYSFHDHSHSESILLNIERLLGNDNIEHLSPTDLWLLLHVAYLHDFGMVILDTKIHDFWQTSDFQYFLKEQLESPDEDIKKAANIILNSDKLKEEYNISWPLEIKGAVTLIISTYCRWQHADFSKDYILDINNIWGIDIGHNGLIKKRLVSLLADISAIHTKQFEDVFKLHKEANGFKNDYMHPRLIASLLRLGDVLDLDNGRFNQYGEKIFGKMPENSRIHFEKHEATKHVLITNQLIEVEADCPTDDIYRETRRWYDSLKSEVDNLHLNWVTIAPGEFSYPPQLAPYKILRNGIEDSYALSSLKFTISQKKAFEIIEGSSIYKDKFSCIREIVQNAEDATKIQLWRDIKNGMYYSSQGIEKLKVENGNLLPNDIPDWIYQIYSIQVIIEKNEDNNALVSIIDHGTGISIDTVKEICNVGESYFQKKERIKEIETMPVWLKPTASFGIGLQSCFMVTDKITIYTNSNKDGRYKLTFKSGKQEGYVNVETLEEPLARGSKVEIVFCDDLNFSYNLWGFTAQNLIKVDPLEVNCIVIFRIIESILKECGSSFFEINITSNSIHFDDKIHAYVTNNNNFPSKLLERDFRYSLSETKEKITCWYNNNLYNVSLNKNSYGKIKIRFKGKCVDKPTALYGYDGFFVEVDIYGIATKEALSLDREELSPEALKKLYTDINYIIDIYLRIILNDIESIKDNTELVDALMLVSWRYKKEFPETLYDKVSDQKYIHIVNYCASEGLYKKEVYSLKDIVKQYPKLPYVNLRIEPDEMMTDVQLLTEEKFVKILNNSNIDKNLYPLLIIDENLKRFLSFQNYDITYLDSEHNEDIGICKVRLDDELYRPDFYTRRRLIQKLVYNEDICKNTRFIMRRAIPAFEEFSSLAVDMNRMPFVEIDEFISWKIISPISLNDAKKIDQLSKEAFVEYIINQTKFDNLILYVKEHRKNKINKEDIITQYKKLIEAYYDIAKTSR